ncbi:MAG: CvpA family protein [Epulopiscium sp.]|nr:CvpA family protein [Candidatus Epulonipiscium sp.]
MFNWMDGIVLGVCLVNGLIAYRRGLVGSLFRIFFYGIGLFLSYKIYPTISRFLRYSTGLFDLFKTKATSVLQLESTIEEYTLQAQRNMIQHLPVPEILKSRLIENNNTEVYNILKVKGLDDYIAGYVANLMMNALTLILVFLIIFIGMKILLKTTDFFTNLPGIRFINKISGLFVGLGIGLIQVWLLYLILIPFYLNPKYLMIQKAIDESLMARYCYENNMILYFLGKIFY